MPELPEVETVVRQLRPFIVGKTVNTATTLHKKTVNYDKYFSRRLQGLTISTISRVGKLIIISFATNKNIHLLTHLKMTGQFFLVDKNNAVVGGGHTYRANDIKSLPNQHSRMYITFSDNSKLFFNDMRLFGYTKLVSSEELSSIITKYGPEPINAHFNEVIEAVAKKIKKKKTTIKAALLDQSIVAGLGNIYVDEALFLAKIRPTKRCNTLTYLQIKSVLRFGGVVMNDSIKVGGTTFQSFNDVYGKPGNYTEQLRVFDRSGMECVNCKTTIKKIKLGGRGTHYCPNCQK